MQRFPLETNASQSVKFCNPINNKCCPLVSPQPYLHYFLKPMPAPIAPSVQTNNMRRVQMKRDTVPGIRIVMGCKTDQEAQQITSSPMHPLVPEVQPAQELLRHLSLYHCSFS
jgi:hypothetical protein